VARERVQSTSEAIELVAQSTGFRDPERMRRAFIRAFGQPPQSLRRAARGNGSRAAGWNQSRSANANHA
jgi:transcriptional regulator GlxA family with amidase domain